MTDTIEVPEVTDLDYAFPSRWRKLLPKWQDLTADEQGMRGPYCDALNRLFARGGKFADYFTPKPGVDAKKVMGIDHGVWCSSCARWQIGN